MPWCPKCQLEYVAGKTNCVECGTELIEELPDAPDLISFMETEKEKLAYKFVQFLHYSKIDSATYGYVEEKKVWNVLIKETTLKQVTKLYQAFYSVETEQQLSGIKEDATAQGNESTNESETSPDYDDSANISTDEYTDFDVEPIDEIPDYNADYNTSSDHEEESMFDDEEIQELYKNSKKKPVPSTIYVKKEEQYKDLKSSAGTFVVVSFLGLLYLILNAVGVIHFFAGPLPYVVMSLLFVAFLYIGITSYLKAKKVETEIGEENRVTEAINTWLLQNVTAEQLDSLTQNETTEEIRFFHKLEKMKEMIITQFGEIDESYLDRLVEEFYNNNFETSVE